MWQGQGWLSKALVLVEVVARVGLSVALIRNRIQGTLPRVP
jgi:hypothetical protein